MSDSIENDTGFAEVLGRFTKEFIKFNNCTTVEAGFLQTEMLTGELSCSLLKAQKEFKSKCESARDQLFEYIDRRVERAVLEERAKQPYKPKTLIDDKDRGIDSAWMARQMKILGSILDRDDR